MTVRMIAPPLTALLAGAVIAACGDSETASTPFAGASNTSDTTTVSGAFALLSKAPNGFDEFSGTAKLIRNGNGTDASIVLSGLKPNTRYVSHVHAGGCDQPDAGGPHFKFVLDGADQPPNEIHLPFTSDAEGDGSANAHSDNTVPIGEGRSIIVHMAGTGAQAGGSSGHSAHGDPSDGNGHSHPPKIACAALGQ